MANSSLLILWLTLIITKFDDYTRVTITQIFDSVIYVRHRYYLENCVERNTIDLLFIEWWDIIVGLSHHYHTLIFIPNKYVPWCNRYYVQYQQELCNYVCKFGLFEVNKNSSMTQLLSHTFTHLTGPSFS